MADSSYYKKKYNAKKKEVKEYEDNIDDLTTVRNRLQDDFYDDAKKVNDEIDDLVEDAKKGVRHCSTFTSNVNKLKDQKEKGVTADPKLSQALRELEEEIARLQKLKREAAEDRDYYYRKYKEKKEEERDAFWDKIF